MKKLLLLTLFTISLIACNSSKRSNPKLTQLLPENTEAVLQINNLASFNSDIKNNAILKLLLTNEDSLPINAIKHLQDFNTTNTLITAFKDNSFAFLTKYHDSLFITEIDTLKFHYKVIDSIYILASDQSFLDEFKLHEVDPFQNLELSNSNSSFSVYLGKENAGKFGNALFNDNIYSFGNDVVLDANVAPEEITLNALSFSTDTISKFIDIFKNTIPQENKITEITPINNRGVLSVTYDDFHILQNNLLKFNQTIIDSTQNINILETFSEVGIITLKNNKNVLVAHAIDEINTNELLNSIENKVSTFRNFDFCTFDTPNYFESVFAPIITLQNITSYTNINDFFIFAEDQNSLQEIVSNYQNGTTLNKDKNFIELKASLSDESSLLVIGNSTKLQLLINKLFSKKLALNNLSSYKYSGFQLVQDDGFVHINGIVKKSKTNAERNTIIEEFNVTLDADVLNNPQFVTNHRTKQKEIVVQDINNSLYLISNKGKVLWKKQLHGPILGKIAQVDLYRNGRLQLAFTTPKRFYILDRNGKDVSPFPLKFNNDITQPLSVFDYDNNKNYRFAITQNNVVIMYDKNGKRINGFNYKSTSASVITQPKHFRVNGRDYIVFATTNELKILNRRGLPRITVNEKVNFSGNEIFRYNNTFTTTSTNGELVQVNLKGNLNKQSLNLVEDHAIFATSKTLATISENNLTIKKRTQELDFGNYTVPKIFYLNDKIYVAITDLQAQKVYLFDSQSKLINNFPVYGNSVIDFANIDGDRNLEFVTKGENNAIILYQKN